MNSGMFNLLSFLTNLFLKHFYSHIVLPVSPLPHCQAEPNLYVAKFDSASSYPNYSHLCSCVRFIPWADSPYDTEPSLEQLEKQGLQGNKVLLEGVKTGSAKVSVRWATLIMAGIRAASVKLVGDLGYYRSCCSKGVRQGFCKVYDSIFILSMRWCKNWIRQFSVRCRALDHCLLYSHWFCLGFRNIINRSVW
jgi:hypothetical protein